MTYITKFFVLLSVVLTGCAHQPSPYNVIESLPYKKGYMNGFYKEGITEEVITANERYKITVKLDGKSTQQRTKDMLLLHASKLTIGSGADKFIVKKMRTFTGCGYSSRSGYQSTVKGFYPHAVGFVKIIKSDNPKKRLTEKQFVALEVEQEKQVAVQKVPSDNFIKQTRKNHLAYCQEKITNNSEGKPTIYKGL